MYRAAIIGLGKIAVEAEDSHLRAYQENKEIASIALFDKLYEKISKFIDVDVFKVIEVNDNYKDIRYRTLDIVSVCTPVESHAQIVCDIAPFVKAIWCEKPISDNLQDAQRMIDVCHKHNVILQINHQRRFIPVKARFSRDYLSTGTHMFDRLRELFGEFKESDIPNTVIFGERLFEIEYLKSNEHIFEVDVVRSGERMLPLALAHLIACIKTGKESISSGEEGMRTLEALLRCKGVLNG